jgi:hypothetical protein
MDFHQLIDHLSLAADDKVFNMLSAHEDAPSFDLKWGNGENRAVRGRSRPRGRKCVRSRAFRTYGGRKPRSRLHWQSHDIHGNATTSTIYREN